jgi:nucleoid DNA-binding protein
MAKLMSKSELIQKIADQKSNGLTRKDIKGVIESLVSVGHKELKKTGAFLVPGFAKFVVHEEARHKATYWHQSFYKGIHNIQGKAS